MAASLPALPPAAYRYPIGDVTVTAVPDGGRTIPLQDGFVRNATRADVNAALKAAFLPEDQVSIYFNPVLLDIAGKLVLIDTGYGEQAAPASYGKLHATLKAIGAPASAIDTVVISHFHGDHINGLVGLEYGRGHFRFAIEGIYSSVPDSIGVGGVSKIYGEDDLGGFVALGKIIYSFHTR